MLVELETPRTEDGWQLELRSYRRAGSFDPSLRPILLIPGYGMNSFILAFHPRGVSLVEHLARVGFEVWTANLRGQGGSTSLRAQPGRIGLRELALIDVPEVISRVLDSTQTAHKEVSVVGCSLGGSILYAYLAHTKDPRVHALVGMGAPLAWDRVHPLMRVAFSSRRVASLLEVKGTRRIARHALPILRRAPRALSIYMNASGIDLSDPDTLVQTVDDPSRELNRDLADWMRTKDLVLDQVNVSHALGTLKIPTLVISANRDGIVPRESVHAIRRALPHAEILDVGDDRDWFAHADLFINDRAEASVFVPLARWLLARGEQAAGKQLGNLVPPTV